MKIERRKLVVAVSAALSSPAFAQFGGLLGFMSGGGGGDVAGQVKAFLEKSIKIEMTLNKSLLAITAAYAKDEDRAKKQALFNDLGKQTDPKEAGAKFQEAYSSNEAEAKKLTESKELDEQTKKLTVERQQQVAKGVVNFLVGALQAKLELIPVGQGIVQGVGLNPFAIVEVVPLKDALPRLGNAVSLAATTIPKFISVLRGANIKVPDVGADTKEEPMEAIT